MKINEVIVDPAWTILEKLAETNRNLVVRIEGLHQIVVIQNKEFTHNEASNMLTIARLYQTLINPEVMRQSAELLTEVIQTLDQDSY